jgi:hypothetical protein
MAPGTLHDTARRIHLARWLELRCFEVLGGWVATTPEPDVKLALSRQSHHHAWHAGLFERVLPVANGFEATIVEMPPPGWQRLVDDLADLSGTADRLHGAYDVLLPAKLAEYQEWLRSADEVRDAPLRRWLGFVVTDELADLAEGRAILDAAALSGRPPGRSPLDAAIRTAGPLLR